MVVAPARLERGSRLAAAEARQLAGASRAARPEGVLPSLATRAPVVGPVARDPLAVVALLAAVVVELQAHLAGVATHQ